LSFFAPFAVFTDLTDLDPVDLTDFVLSPFADFNTALCVGPGVEGPGVGVIVVPEIEGDSDGEIEGEIEGDIVGSEVVGDTVGDTVGDWVHPMQVNRQPATKLGSPQLPALWPLAQNLGWQMSTW